MRIHIHTYIHLYASGHDCRVVYSFTLGTMCCLCVECAVALRRRKSDDTINLAIQRAKNIYMYIHKYIHIVLVKQNKGKEMANSIVEWVAAKKLLTH